jgi:hypothetical protein
MGLLTHLAAMKLRRRWYQHVDVIDPATPLRE